MGAGEQRFKFFFFLGEEIRSSDGSVSNHTRKLAILCYILLQFRVVDWSGVKWNYWKVFSLQAVLTKVNYLEIMVRKTWPSARLGFRNWNWNLRLIDPVNISGLDQWRSLGREMRGHDYRGKVYGDSLKRIYGRNKGGRWVRSESSERMEDILPALWLRLDPSLIQILTQKQINFLHWVTTRYYDGFTNCLVTSFKTASYVLKRLRIRDHQIYYHLNIHERLKRLIVVTYIVLD